MLELIHWTPRLLQRHFHPWVIVRIDVLWYSYSRELLYHYLTDVTPEKYNCEEDKSPGIKKDSPMIKGLIHSEYIGILNVNILNKRSLKYIKQKVVELK